MKCVYHKNDLPRCKKTADFIVYGVSYCEKHADLRTKEWTKEKEESDSLNLGKKLEESFQEGKTLGYETGIGSQITRIEGKKSHYRAQGFFFGVLFVGIVFIILTALTTVPV